MLGLFSKLVFLGSAQRRILKQGVPIFTYHRVARPTSGTIDPYLYVTQQAFAAQLHELRRAGYESGSLESAARSDAGRVAVITFDDGFSSVVENGLEPLARYGFKAVQFLIAGRLGQWNDWDAAKGDVSERLIDEQQVREWLAAGHEIGSHSLTHRNLKHLNTRELRNEIFESKKALEDRFDRPIKHFCYPYGAYTKAALELVAEAGYKTACTVKFGVNNASISQFELLRIIPVSSRQLAGKITHRLLRRLRR